MQAKLYLASVCAAAALACASPANPSLERAEAEYDAAAADSEVTTYAPLELREAAGTLERAQRAYRADEDVEQVDHLAYLASRRVEIAQVSADKKADQALRRNVDIDVHVHDPDVHAPAASADRRVAILTAELAEALTALDAVETDRGAVIVMDEVWFDRERSALRPDALPDLARLATFLNTHPNLEVIVEGHADRHEVDPGTGNLSLARAEAVEDYLEDEGVDDDRIATRALGASEPVSAGATPVGRQQNRRVEIVVVE